VFVRRTGGSALRRNVFAGAQGDEPLGSLGGEVGGAGLAGVGEHSAYVRAADVPVESVPVVVLTCSTLACAAVIIGWYSTAR
jgi:hypothetical protein